MSARRDAGLALIALVLLLVWDASGADLALVRLFGTADGFAWRDQWFASKVLHEGAQWIGRAVFVLLLLNVFRPLPLIGDLPRRERLAWCLITAVCAIVVASLKHSSRISCPWSLAEFGGTARYLSHWSAAAWWGAGDGGPGACFPSGHASAAFSFFAGVFALRRRAPRRARGWLAGVWAFGLLFGLTQLVRGAHYASHTLWAAWICWSLSALLWHGLVARPAPAAEAAMTPG